MRTAVAALTAILLAGSASSASARGLEPINPKDPNVIPINWLSFPASMPADADSLKVRTVLRNANKFALTTWYNSSKNFDSQAGVTYLDFGGIDEGNIRSPASEALSLAIALKLGAYDATHTGVSDADAKAITLKLIRSLAYRHLVNTAGGWGNGWQPSLWAYYAGMAGWLMWDDLSATDREYVRKMVVYEADRLIGYQVPYYRNPAGTILTHGDSKGEENSWSAAILQLATSMMPRHTNYRAWMYKNVELMISAYARPADLSNSTVYNGAPFSWWLNGSNINDDYVMVNHDRIHPDYSTTISQNLTTPLIAAMAGVPAPSVAKVNAENIYDTLVDMSFTPGTSYPDTLFTVGTPGGTIYTTSAYPDDIYYPHPNDWGYNRRIHFAGYDIMMRAFGLDGLASTPAITWERQHIAKVLADQARGTDGRTYQAPGEDTYALGREEWVAAHAARAWWIKWLSVKGLLASAFSNQAIAPVIDNKDRGFSVISGGSWTAVTTGAEKLGTGYLTVPAGTGARRVRYSFNIPTAGNYKIYAWWSAAPSNATNARYTVQYASGSTTVTKNQMIDGGKFNLVGTYAFNAGTGQGVEIDDAANGAVVADAILFMRTDTL